MKFEIEPSFDTYFTSAEETTREILNTDSPFVAALRTYHLFFVEHIFTEETTMSPIQAMLAMHCFMIYLSAIRVAISGHEAATFPLFRTALETSCYAFLIGETVDLERVWLQRHNTPEALKICRRKFTSAVNDTAKSIQAQDRISKGTEDWINQAYDAAIDFGAHPNPKSILPHIWIDEDRLDGHVGVNLAGLHSATSFEISRSLMACLDYGLLIALILVRCLEENSDADLIALNELNDLKEQLTGEHFSIK